MMRAIALSSSTRRIVSRTASAMVDRHGELEPGATRRLVGDVEVAAVRLDDGAADSEADPARRAAGAPAERLEQLGPTAEVHTRALVCDPGLDGCAGRACPDFEGGHRRG